MNPKVSVAVFQIKLTQDYDWLGYKGLPDYLVSMCIFPILLQFYVPFYVKK